MFIKHNITHVCIAGSSWALISALAKKTLEILTFLRTKNAVPQNECRSLVRNYQPTLSGILALVRYFRRFVGHFRNCKTGLA